MLNVVVGAQIPVNDTRSNAGDRAAAARV